LNHAGFSEAPLVEVVDLDLAIQQGARYDMSNAMIGVRAGCNFAEIVLLVLISGFAQTDRDAFDLFGSRFLFVDLQSGGDWRLRINETGPDLETIFHDLEVSGAPAKDVLLQLS